MTLKKNNVSSVTANIEALSHEGRGIAHLSGKTVFIDNALQGETVEFHYQRRHRQYDEGLAIQVIEHSPLRVAPLCPHFLSCGGCSLQHMTALGQLQLKENTFLEQLAHFAKIKPEEILPPLVGDSWGYRHKARLSVRFVKKKSRVLVGFREKYSRFVAEMNSCDTLHTAVGQRIEALSKLIQGLKAAEDIPQIEVAIAENAHALIFRHLKPLSHPDKIALSAFAEKHNFSIYLQPSDAQSVHKHYPVDNDLFLTYSLPEFDLTFYFHPLDFTQINMSLNRRMVSQAVTLLSPQPQETILDLFCGIGNFSLPIAKKGGQVIGIEGSAEMVARAKMNAEKNHLSNKAHFYTAHLEKISTEPWIKKIDKLLLDPPRCGAKHCVENIALWDPSQIVYIACNPATFARDAGILVHQQGYQLKKAGIIDMFPQTAHVEVMGLFIKK